MWESENQDESPLMTTDDFHGIDRLGSGKMRAIGFGEQNDGSLGLFDFKVTIIDKRS
jgi:hypothetical protein